MDRLKSLCGFLARNFTNNQLTEILDKRGYEKRGTLSTVEMVESRMKNHQAVSQEGAYTEKETKVCMDNIRSQIDDLAYPPRVSTRQEKRRGKVKVLINTSTRQEWGIDEVRLKEWKGSSGKIWHKIRPSMDLTGVLAVGRVFRDMDGEVYRVQRVRV